MYEREEEEGSEVKGGGRGLLIVFLLKIVYQCTISVSKVKHIGKSPKQDMLEIFCLVTQRELDMICK